MFVIFLFFVSILSLVHTKASSMDGEIETQHVNIGKLNKKVNDLNKVVFEMQKELKQCKSIVNDADELESKKQNGSHILQRSKLYVY